MPKDRADLSGKLTTLAQKRITKERQKIEEERKELEECGIYTIWGDELHKTVALIVGPDDTPYAHGFYFFEVQFTDNYPMQPPHVVFKTGDGRVRFNPNLYVEGKVCLSILGTWAGPSWTSSCTLRTVLVSIQSLLNAHPIQNEPGHERERGRNDELYSDIIRYENVAVAVVRMLKQTPPKFEAFRPKMRAVFLNNFDTYLKTIEAYEDRNGKSATAPIWAFCCKFKSKDVAAELQQLRTELLEEEARDSALPEAAEAAEAAAAADGQVPGEKRAAEGATLPESSEAKRAKTSDEHR